MLKDEPNLGKTTTFVSADTSFQYVNSLINIDKLAQSKSNEECKQIVLSEKSKEAIYALIESSNVVGVAHISKALAN
jgi:hypothetical protein